MPLRNRIATGNTIKLMSGLIATITGVIGAITGVAGSIMGYIAFRDSRRIKTSERRLELEVLRNEVHMSSVKLVDLLPQALGSKRASLAARGLSQSSSMDQFVEAHRKDSSRVNELAQSIPAVENDFKSLTLSELDEKIVELDRTKGWISELIEKYENSLEQDSEWSRNQSNRR